MARPEKISKKILPFIDQPSFHATYYPVNEKLKKWLTRFFSSADDTVINDLNSLYLQAPKRFFDHRDPSHLCHLVLSLHFMQKKLQQSAIFFPHERQIEIRCMSATLSFPFSSKSVLGCLIGFNALERHEALDEENVLLTLQKHIPKIALVTDSIYCHALYSSYHLKLFYLEFEKNASAFSLLERSLLRSNLTEIVKNSVLTICSSTYMDRNDEEIYKKIIVLGQELHSPQDVAQAHISFYRQTRKEIIFRILMVFAIPSYPISFQERFSKCTFVSERVQTIKYIDGHPIEAHIFYLHLLRDASLLRMDGSLDFYGARQKIVILLKEALGEFRDYNGGMMLKQEEQLEDLKRHFPEICRENSELIDTFFYSLSPMEKQVILPQKILLTLFSHYLENYQTLIFNENDYSFKIKDFEQHRYLLVHGNHSSLTSLFNAFLKKTAVMQLDFAHIILNSAYGTFFNCVILDTDKTKEEAFIQDLKEILLQWQQKRKERKVLRIALEFSLVSLDPCIGGDGNSADILSLLFQGLTRLNSNECVENALAKSIEISGSKEYLFKLRPSFWSDGSPLTAYDFEYAWKKILSPSFKTAFAHLFYPIKNAKQVKEGIIPPDQLGIYPLDDQTLKVELEHPAPYFLKLTAHSLYSPVHRIVDQQYPQWPYQSEKYFPCNGPFQLKVNQPKHGYQLVKNPFYWEASQVEIDEIRFNVMKPIEALRAFNKKEIDWIGNPFGFFDYKADSNSLILSFSTVSTFWLVMNTTYKPLHHPKIRQAFAYAIQRSQFARNPLSFKPAYSVFPPYKGQQSLFPDYSKDKARQLFYEGLRELGIDEKDFPSLNLLCHEVGTQKNTALSLKAQFKETLGVECNLKPLAWNQQFSKMISGDFQIGLTAWASSVDDPIYILSVFKSANHELNFTNWESENFVRFIDLSEQEANPFKRASYFLKAEEILSSEMPIIPLFHQNAQALVAKDFPLFNQSSSCISTNLAKIYSKKESWIALNV